MTTTLPSVRSTSDQTLVHRTNLKNSSEQLASSTSSSSMHHPPLAPSSSTPELSSHYFPTTITTTTSITPTHNHNHNNNYTEAMTMMNMTNGSHHHIQINNNNSNQNQNIDSPTGSSSSINISGSSGSSGGILGYHPHHYHHHHYPTTATTTTTTMTAATNIEINGTNHNNDINNNNNINHMKSGSNNRCQFDLKPQIIDSLPHHHHHQQQQQHQQQQESLMVFSMDIMTFPPYLQLLICILFMFVFYTLSGIVQEYLFVQYDDFDYGFFLTLIQFLFYSFTSYFMMRNQQRQKQLQQQQQQQQGLSSSAEKPFVTEAPKVNIPLSYLMLGTLMMAGVGLGNESMNYLNYPTKILFKSSKLLLAMVIGVCVTGKKYNKMDYLASLSLALGLVMLYTANTSASVRFELKGVFLIMCALASDSVSINLQERILQEGDQSPLQLIFYSHAVGSIYLLIVCMLTGQLTNAVAFLYRNPLAILLILLYCVLCFVGVQFVHVMTKLYGILATLTATSTRKVLSILLSYVIFPKPFLLAHFLAVVLVFGGVFLRIYNKNKEDFDDLFAHYLLGRKRMRPTQMVASKSKAELII